MPAALHVDRLAEISCGAHGKYSQLVDGLTVYPIKLKAIAPSDSTEKVFMHSSRKQSESKSEQERKLFVLRQSIQLTDCLCFCFHSIAFYLLLLKIGLVLKAMAQLVESVKVS